MIPDQLRCAIGHAAKIRAQNSSSGQKIASKIHSNIHVQQQISKSMTVSPQVSSPVEQKSAFIFPSHIGDRSHRTLNPGEAGLSGRSIAERIGQRRR